MRHGLITLAGMIEYHLPGMICGALGLKWGMPWLQGVGIILWIMATLAVPGYMSHYCYTLNPREVFDPFRAMRRVIEGGSAYWHAWLIALAALALSFTGLAVFGLGFLITSVWFWQVAGFSFATVFTQAHHLNAMSYKAPRPAVIDRT